MPCRLEELGTAEQAGQRFLSTTVAPEGSCREADLLSATSRCLLECIQSPGLHKFQAFYNNSGAGGLWSRGRPAVRHLACHCTSAALAVDMIYLLKFYLTVVAEGSGREANLLSAPQAPARQSVLHCL